MSGQKARSSEPATATCMPSVFSQRLVDREWRVVHQGSKGAFTGAEGATWAGSLGRNLRSKAAAASSGSLAPLKLSLASTETETEGNAQEEEGGCFEGSRALRAVSQHTMVA